MKWAFVTVYSMPMRDGSASFAKAYWSDSVNHPTHAFLRAHYVDAVTYAHPDKVITHLNGRLRMRPIVLGGWVVAGNPHRPEATT